MTITFSAKVLFLIITKTKLKFECMQVNREKNEICVCATTFHFFPSLSIALALTGTTTSLS
jgi:hypothetical protein